MSTQAIQAYQGALTNYSNSKSEAASMEDVLNGKQDSSSSSGSDSLKAKLRDRIESLLSGVPSSGTKLSFQDVIDYRDQLLEEFEAQAKADLEALGVDTDLDFTLSYDADTDTVTADSGHPDKSVIDAYFKENSDMREAFAQVVTYSNLVKPAETTVSPQAMMKQLQLKSMSVWFSDTLSTSSLSAGLSGFGSLMFSQDSETSYFGIDLLV